MAESKKSSIIMVCAIVACIVTLITCGTLIGGTKTDVDYLKQMAVEAKKEREHFQQKQADMETKQAFLEGVVVTKLDALTTDFGKFKDYIMQYDFREKGK